MNEYDTPLDLDLSFLDHECAQFDCIYYGKYFITLNCSHRVCIDHVLLPICPDCRTPIDLEKVNIPKNIPGYQLIVNLINKQQSYYKINLDYQIALNKSYEQQRSLKKKLERMVPGS